MSDRDLQKLIEDALEDGPGAARMTSRAMVRGRVREVHQRPAWRTRERGDEYPGRRYPQLRLLVIGVALVSLLGMTFVLAGPGGRPPIEGPWATPRVTAYPIDGQPLGVAVADGDVWAGLFDVNVVVRLDPETGEMTRIPSRGRNCVSMSAGAGGVWVPACIASSLVRIDPATNEVTSMTPSGQGQTTSPAFDGDTAWLTLDVDSGLYALYDTRNEAEIVRRRLPQPGRIAAVAFNSAWALIHPDGGPYSALRLDPLDGTEGASVPLAGFPDMAVATGDALWVSTIDEAGGRSALVSINPATDAVDAVIDFEQPVVYPAADGLTLWAIAVGDTTTIYRVDVAAGTATEHFALDARADAFAIDGDTLWISDGGARELLRIDLAG